MKGCPTFPRGTSNCWLFSTIKLLKRACHTASSAIPPFKCVPSFWCTWSSYTPSILRSMSMITESGRSANSLSPVEADVPSTFAVFPPTAAGSVPVDIPPTPTIPFGCWIVVITSFSFLQLLHPAVATIAALLFHSQFLTHLEVNLLQLQQWSWCRVDDLVVRDRVEMLVVEFSIGRFAVSTINCGALPTG